MKVLYECVDCGQVISEDNLAYTYDGKPYHHNNGCSTETVVISVEDAILLLFQQRSMK